MAIDLDMHTTCSWQTFRKLFICTMCIWIGVLTVFPQILMNVLTPVKITVALMPTALTLLEVMTAPAMLDTLEMATHVMVCTP